MLTFERGDATRPKGHALLYYRDAAGGRKLLATYVVVLPVSVDVVRYMPPFLAPHAAELTARGLSAFAFPPVPEPMESVERLRQLADARDEDLLYGGEIDITQVHHVLERVNDQVQEYAESYNAHVAAMPSPQPQAPIGQPDLSGLGVNEVLYEFMSDRDRLAEITKLIGTLRFALGGNDERLAQETAAEVRALAKRLPANCAADVLVKAACDPSSAGALLAQLYLDRCYKLLDDDVQAVRELDERIRAAQAFGQ